MKMSTNGTIERRWQDVIEEKSKGLAVIKLISPFSFEKYQAKYTYGTGFIVDLRRGLILTNRHITGAGPSVGTAMFYNQEQVDVKSIYHDPIHDFALLQFDISQVKHANLIEIGLDPSAAQIGVDIRVMGNDAGQNLSILPGSISHLDSNAPGYGFDTYNDLNTFYIQASTNVSRGSSGSPVFNIEGKAVGLVACGMDTESFSLYVPLDRIQYTLEFIKAGLPVSRGTIHATFVYQPIDMVSRLGTPDEVIDQIRLICPSERSVGMLVAFQILPEGAAQNAGMNESDVLYKINGQIVNHFVQLEQFMDSHVHGTLSLSVYRGSELIEMDVKVDDLQALQPSKFLSIGRTVFHDMIYHLAAYHVLPCTGVLIKNIDPLVSDHQANEEIILVKSVGGKVVKNLDQLIEVLGKFQKNQHIEIKYDHPYYYYNNYSDLVTIQVNEFWNKIKLYTRNDNTGMWDSQALKLFKDVPKDSAPNQPNVETAIFPQIKSANAKHLQKVVQSLVKVTRRVPVPTNEDYQFGDAGFGVVIDARKGLVLVSQFIITTVSIFTVTIADTLTVPAKLIFRHPDHPYAIIQYDPKDVGQTDICSLEFSGQPLASGDNVSLVALNSNGDPICVNTEISKIECVPNDAIVLEYKWFTNNTETLRVEHLLCYEYEFGVLVDASSGQAQAIWQQVTNIDNERSTDNLTNYGGLAVQNIIPVLTSLQQGDTNPTPRNLNIKLNEITLASAKKLGLSSQTLEFLQKHGPHHTGLYQIQRIEGLSKALGVLEPHDVIISINGRFAQRLTDFNIQYTNEFLEMIVLRDSKELNLAVETTETKQNREKLVCWAGAIFKAPSKAVLQSTLKVPSRVYCAYVYDGSPAVMYDMVFKCWVTHVNEIETPDIDAFEMAVKSVPDNAFARIRIEGTQTTSRMLTIKPCYHHWPTSSLTRDLTAENGWRFSSLENM